MELSKLEKHYCINCGKEASELHHVVPLALGGNDIDSNKVWLCIECHNKIHKRGLGMGQLAAESPNYRQAVKDGRVGRPRVELPPKFYELYPLWKEGKITAVAFAKELDICRATLYRRMSEYEISLKQKEDKI